VLEELSTGSDFAGYRIESVIGRGGMGVVYLATHERLERRVALKLIAPERAADEAFRRRFLRESKLAASIEHPHAVPVYEADAADDGTVFIAMRYVEGTDLGALLETESWLDPPRAARLLGQIAEALDQAHRRGLVHRDVKPANVLIGEVGDEEWAYLTDFGATKPSAGTDLTGTGEWLGTLGYASPEQIQGQAVDARSDVYSLGCVMFEALTGQPPYERGDHVAKLFAHVNDPPPTVTELAPDLPAELDRVIARALAKTPSERFPSAGDLARAASAAIAGEAITTAERSVATGEARAGVATAEAPTRVLRRLWPGRAGGRARWLWAGAALAGLAAVAAALLLFRGDGEGPRVIETIEVDGRPLGLAVARGEVWVTDRSGGVVSRIDAESNEVMRGQIPVGDDPVGVKFGAGSLWVANSGSDTVSRIDAGSAKVIDEIPVGRSPAGVRAGEGAVWVTNIDDDTVSRIDPRSKRVEEIEVGDAPAGIAIGEGGVWVANAKDGTVSRIAPDLEVVDEIEVGARPRGIAAGRDAIWVASGIDGTVTRIDPDTSEVEGEPIDVGDGPGQIVVGESWIWVTNERDDTVSRLDPDTGEVVGEPIEVGDAPRAITLGQDSVWVANSGDGTISRIQS
jgi:YVTN family beta-propeller protein